MIDAGVRAAALAAALSRLLSHRAEWTIDGAVRGIAAAALRSGRRLAGRRLISGSILARGHTYEMDEYGGLADRAPALTALTAVAAFASLGPLPERWAGWQDLGPAEIVTLGLLMLLVVLIGVAPA